MKSRCVLVVNERSSETTVIRKVLMGENPRTTIFAVQNGRQALDVLMGGKSDIFEEGILPDAVIVSDSLSDMKPSDIKSIVSKYYRLRNIRFYLLSEVGNKTAQDVTEGFAGFFQRPIADDRATRKKFLPLKMELGDNAASLSAIPIIGFLTKKISAISGMGLTAGAKAAACIAIVGTVCAVSVAVQPKAPTATIQSAYVDGEVIPTLIPKMEISLPDLSVAEPVIAEEKEIVVPAPIVQPNKDSIAPDVLKAEPVRRQFSIGVREMKKTFE